MKIYQNRKSLALVSAATSLITGVSAHAGEQDYHNGMMWSSSSWMHDMSHMAGYNMWGPGWTGVIVGLIIWTLAIVGVYHIYQEYVQEKEGE